MPWPDPDPPPILPVWLRRNGRAIFYSCVGGAALVIVAMWLATVVSWP